MSDHQTVFERIEEIKKAIAISQYQDLAYTDELYADLAALVEEANQDYEIWCENAVEGIDYVVINKDKGTVEETKDEDDEPIKGADGGFLSDESERMMREMHSALFNNPNSTKEQNEEEIIKQMMARRIAKGVKNRNSGR